MINNPISFNDPLGDTIPINLFNPKDNAHPAFNAFAKNAVENISNDGVFLVMGHGNSDEVSTHKKDEVRRSDDDYFYTPKQINDYLTTQSKEYGVAMKNKKDITVIFTACNSASKEYKDENAPYKIIKTEQPIAYKYSKAYPNITVIAADGYVTVIGNSQNAQLAGVKNELSKDAGFLIIKNGVEIGRMSMSQFIPESFIK
jgi:hypothetical protein